MESVCLHHVTISNRFESGTVHHVNPDHQVGFCASLSDVEASGFDPVAP
jgi:hypothetical protein